MDNQKTLKKINLLLNLSLSPNKNESLAAIKQVEELKNKYNISDEEIAEFRKTPPNYSNEENLLFKSDRVIDWKVRLAFILASKFYCYVIQENNTMTTGDEFLNYYLFGEDCDIKIIKALFKVLCDEIDNCRLISCLSKHFNYESSYCIGLIDGIEERILYGELELPGIITVRPIYNKQEVSASDNQIVSTNKTKTLPKEKPVENVSNVNQQEFVKDVFAWQKGLIDSEKIEISSEKLNIPELRD